VAKNDLLDLLIVSLLVEGHVLIEGFPELQKTRSANYSLKTFKKPFVEFSLRLFDA